MAMIFSYIYILTMYYLATTNSAYSLIWLSAQNGTIPRAPPLEVHYKGSSIPLGQVIKASCSSLYMWTFLV